MPLVSASNEISNVRYLLVQVTSHFQISLISSVSYSVCPECGELWVQSPPLAKLSKNKTKDWALVHERELSVF